MYHSDLKRPASSTVRNKFLLFKSYSVYCAFIQNSTIGQESPWGQCLAHKWECHQDTLCLCLSTLFSTALLFLTLHASKIAIIKFKFQVQETAHSCGKTFHAVALQIWWDIFLAWVSCPSLKFQPTAFKHVDWPMDEWGLWYYQQKKEEVDNCGWSRE